jgi:hypothetical protein
MRFKQACTLLLLSIFSFHFLCPALCPVTQADDCRTSTADASVTFRQYLAPAKAETSAGGSTCCNAENRADFPRERPEADDNNCCLTRLDLLKASELQPFLQTQKGKCLFVALIPAIYRIPSNSTPITSHLQFAHIPCKAPPTHQLSPRAPPLSLA